MKLAYQYLHFTPVPTLKGKPQRYSCRNTKSDCELGTVQYYPAWRCYCYFPTVQAVYSEGCLKDIAEFVGAVEAERKAGK